MNPFRSLGPLKTSVFFKPLLEQPLEPALAFLLAPPLWLLMRQQWWKLLLLLLLLLWLLLLLLLLWLLLLLLLLPLWQEARSVSSQVEGKATKSLH